VARSRRNKRKVRAHIEGRTLRGKHPVTPLPRGEFAYGKFVYEIQDFPLNCTVNLDKLNVDPVRAYERPKKKKKKKQPKVHYSEDNRAWLFDNRNDCPDVQYLFA